ncbi:MAG TPA: hypothetical protein VH143_30315 [Kofleriaceae bacterium]|nr:hypothetical protein [Kofleriaceae bacterium]
MKRALLFVMACSSAPKPSPPPVANAWSPAGSAATEPACKLAGDYLLTLDLDAAKITYSDARITDMSWCKQTLASFFAASMRQLTVHGDAATLRVEWPPGQPATVEVTAACKVAIRSRAIAASVQLDFNADGITGAMTFTAPAKQAGETCTAADTPVTLLI